MISSLFDGIDETAEAEDDPQATRPRVVHSDVSDARARSYAEPAPREDAAR